MLGDAVEWGALVLEIDTCPQCARPNRSTLTITLPKDHVFEDIAPRLADLDLDGTPEIIVVESDIRLGAALAIYDETGKITETPHYDRPNRWLALVGAADLDGDGLVEIAYIDRPHLAKTLRIWRFENNTLTPVATQPGLTNHRIGEDFISGGIRTCAAPTPEIITANADWTRLIASTLADETITSRDIGPNTTPASFTAALTCR